MLNDERVTREELQGIVEQYLERSLKELRNSEIIEEYREESRELLMRWIERVTATPTPRKRVVESEDFEKIMKMLVQNLEKYFEKYVANRNEKTGIWLVRNYPKIAAKIGFQNIMSYEEVEKLRRFEEKSKGILKKLEKGIEKVDDPFGIYFRVVEVEGEDALEYVAEKLEKAKEADEFLNSVEKYLDLDKKWRGTLKKWAGGIENLIKKIDYLKDTGTEEIESALAFLEKVNVPDNKKIEILKTTSELLESIKDEGRIKEYLEKYISNRYMIYFAKKLLKIEKRHNWNEIIEIAEKQFEKMEEKGIMEERAYLIGGNALDLLDLAKSIGKKVSPGVITWAFKNAHQEDTVSLRAISTYAGSIFGKFEKIGKKSIKQLINLGRYIRKAEEIDSVDSLVAVLRKEKNKEISNLTKIAKEWYREEMEKVGRKIGIMAEDLINGLDKWYFAIGENVKKAFQVPTAYRKVEMSIGNYTVSLDPGNGKDQLMALAKIHSCLSPVNKTREEKSISFAYVMHPDIFFGIIYSKGKPAGRFTVFVGRDPETGEKKAFVGSRVYGTTEVDERDIYRALEKFARENGLGIAKPGEVLEIEGLERIYDDYVVEKGKRGASILFKYKKQSFQANL